MNLEKEVKSLLQKKGVVSVGKGIKQVKGNYTGEPAIVIGVREKLSLHVLATKDIVPSMIGDIVTDVVEVGEIKLLSEDRTKNWRPAPGGVSIGHYEITAGTLGRLVHKNEQIMILSNNHILANMNEAEIGDPILQPSAYDGGTAEDEIAKLHSYVEINKTGVSTCPFANAIVSVLNHLAEFFGRQTRLASSTGFQKNLVDCALAKPNNDHDVSSSILETGEIAKGDVEPTLLMKVKKSGRSSRLTFGEITQIEVTANVQAGDGEFAIFTNQFAMGGKMSEPGDSGSVILTEDNKCVGLLFAGSETMTLANKYSNVKEALSLD